jgi:rubrerythrin
MVSNISACVRITTKRNTVWRECARCGALAALAPAETHCPACTSPAPAARRPGRQRAA